MEGFLAMRVVGDFHILFPRGTREIDSFLDPCCRKEYEMVLESEIRSNPRSTTHELGDFEEVA